MNDTNYKGNVAQAQILSKLVSLGRSVLVPFSDKERYDLAVDDGGKLVRIQVKSGRLRNGVIIFNTCSQHRVTWARNYYSEAEIDYYGVYCPDLDSCYLVPVSEMRSEGRLRVDAPSYNRTKDVHLAKDYEI